MPVRVWEWVADRCDGKGLSVHVMVGSDGRKILMVSEIQLNMDLRTITLKKYESEHNPTDRRMDIEEVTE